jgi:hypothetical protein
MGFYGMYVGWSWLWSHEGSFWMEKTDVCRNGLGRVELRDWVGIPVVWCESRPQARHNGHAVEASVERDITNVWVEPNGHFSEHLQVY